MGVVMPRVSWSRLLVLSLSLASSRAQDADAPPASEQKEDKIPGISTVVVVTASKMDEAQQDVTQKVNVIHEDQIAAQATSFRNISEFLQYQPGISVTVLSRNDANWGSYGGLGPKYNSYLLDGLPIDSFVDPMSLDPWAFERIETHQGPASVMYSNYLSSDFAGAQAPLAGITNLILKERIERPMTHVLLDGGSWKTFGARLYHQGYKGKLHYFLGGTYEQSDYTNYGAPNSWLGMLEDPSYKKMKFYGKATYFLTDRQKLSFFAQHTLHDGFTGRINRDYGHNYDTLNAAYANQVNDTLNIQVKTGLRNYDRRWGDDNYPASLALLDHSGVQQTIVPTDLTFNFKHHGESVFAVGADAQYATYSTYVEANAPRTTGNDASALSTGVYLQEKCAFGKWVLRAGGRFNVTSDTYKLIGGVAPGVSDKSWSRFLWSAGARYNFSTRLAAYGNAGTSFISPAAKSVGGTLNAGDVGLPGRNGQLPNPNLKPESGIGSDFGIDYAVTERVTVGARGFYNNISDAIVENVISNTPSQTKSVNAGDANSYGFELVYHQYVSDKVHLFANYTRSVSRIHNPIDQDQDGATIPFVPGYLFNAGLELNLPRAFRLSPYLHAVGEYFDSTSKSGRSVFGPYQVLNLNVEKTIYRTDSYSVVLFMDLNNLTDSEYLMPWQFKDPGFNMLGGLDFRF
jgi:iron complex outermembrane receptor protein